MIAADNERMPTPLLPRDLLTGELPGSLWYWTSASTAQAARALLAVWAGLQRLERTGSDPDEDRLNALVHTETGRLVHAAGEGIIFDLDDWLRRAEDLDRTQDTSTEDADELHWQAHDLFERLDRADRVLWSLQKLGGPDQNAGRFASDRHRRIEEARDELETSLDRANLLASARSEGTGTVQPATQVQIQPTSEDQSPWLMQAAGSGPEDTALLHRLASESPVEGPTTNPGLAWAHFLAATLLDTGLQDL